MDISTFILSEDDIINLVDDATIETVGVRRPITPPIEETMKQHSLQNTSNSAVTKKRSFDQVYLFNPEKTSNIGGNDTKQNYGWFVDIETDIDYSARVENVTTITRDDDLSFKSCTAPKRNTNLDNEVDWAVAADIIDDVLNYDLPFKAPQRKNNHLVTMEVEWTTAADIIDNVLSDLSVSSNNSSNKRRRSSIII